MKVLVVDDEAMICEWLQFCISQNPSCQLTGVAHNGQEALELFHRDEPDLILTDIKMPVMDGLEFLHALKALGSRAKIVVLTAFSDFSLVRQALREGASEYLLKTEMQNDLLQELLNRIAPGLLTWYDKSRRSLPWREEPTPYRVWVSEIMLQQTRVEAVKPYFARFMERLPDIEALAEVDDDELLKLWEGLGSYSRARNLKAAAQQIVTEYGGEMPSDYRELLKLKGIGSYTAGAVSSIAFKQPNPAVDGNVLRVIARLLEDNSDISDQSVKKRVEDELRPVMPKDRPGDFNQALMELGATVCLPNGAPKCSNCPWQEFCLVGLHGTWQQYPQKAAKKARTIEDKTILVIRTSRQVVLRKRPKKGLLAGLYEFPAMDKKASLEEVREWLKKQGVEAVRMEKLPESKHIFTHKEWHMTGYQVLVDELEPMGQDESLLFVETQEIEKNYPIPSAFAAYSAYLRIQTGIQKMKGTTL